MVDVSISSGQLQPQQQTSNNTSNVANNNLLPINTAIASVGQQINPQSLTVNASANSERSNVGDDDASRRGRGTGSGNAQVNAENSARQLALLRGGVRARVIFDFSSSPVNGTNGARALLEISSIETGQPVSVINTDDLTSFLESQILVPTGSATVGSRESPRLRIDS